MMKFFVSEHSAWALTLALLVVDAVWLGFGGWSIAPRGLALALLALIGSLAPLMFPRYRRDLRISTTARAAALLVTFTNVAATLSYLVVSTKAPLVDATLAAWDHAFYFDWRAVYGWLVEHPLAHAVLVVAYNSGLAQIVVVVLFLGLTARTTRLHEFVRLFVLATSLTVAFSGPFPASGPWAYYGLGAQVDLSVLSHFEPLRTGSLRHIPLGAMQGLIAMPSLHAALAVLLVYAMRGTGIAFAAVAVLDSLMILSTPTEGGHYLVDVLAGCALAACLIALCRRVALAPVERAQPLGAVALGEAHR